MPTIRPASPASVDAQRACDDALLAFSRGDMARGEDRMVRAAETKPQRGIEYGDLCVENGAFVGAVRCYSLTPLDPPRVRLRHVLEKQGDAFARVAFDATSIGTTSAVLAVQSYAAAFAPEPSAYTPHLKRFEVLSEMFCACRFGADWFSLCRFWEGRPGHDPSSDAAEGGAVRVYLGDVFCELAQELAATLRLLPFPQQLHDASFLWPWAHSNDDKSIAALREHIVPLLDTLLMHRLADSVRHTDALDRAALAATGNLGRLPVFGRTAFDLLMAYQTRIPLKEETLDAFADAYGVLLAGRSLDEETLESGLRTVRMGLPQALHARLDGIVEGLIPVPHMFARIAPSPATVQLPRAAHWFALDPTLHNAMSEDHALHLGALDPTFVQSLPAEEFRDFLDELTSAPQPRVRFDLPGCDSAEDSEPTSPDGDVPT